MNCLSCNINHDGSFGSGKYCSRSCANKRVHTEQTKEKISRSVATSRPAVQKFSECIECNKTFLMKSATAKCCSRKCSSQWVHRPENISQETRDKLRLSAVKRHAQLDGNIGFTTRKKFQSSFPEVQAENFFALHGIKFEREVRIGKWFADFVLPGKLVVEIDGKQHLLPDRKNGDNIKDAHLESLGYQIIRIPYRKLDKEFFDALRKILFAATKYPSVSPQSSKL